MHKIGQFLEYSYIIDLYPRLMDIVYYSGKNLSFEQFSRVLIQYSKEKVGTEPATKDKTIQQLYDDFMDWWDNLSSNKKNFILSTNISNHYWLDKKICPRCESGTLRNGKAQKIEKQWQYPTTCSNKQCSLHNNTQIYLNL